MAALRMAIGGLLTLFALGLTAAPVLASTARTAPTPKPLPPVAAPRATTVRLPQVYQVNPLKVNPTVQPKTLTVGHFLPPPPKFKVAPGLAPTTQCPVPNQHV